MIHYQASLEYLKPTFSINDLVRDLNMPKNIVDNYFKNELNVKFIDFIHAYRIKHFIETISKKDLDRLKLEEIALQFGFKNRNSFIVAFQKNHMESFNEFKKKLKA